MDNESNALQETRSFNWFRMFWDGMRNLSTLGKTLWLIVIVKLIIMFLVLRPFFFPNVLNSNYDTETEKADHVREELIKKSN